MSDELIQFAVQLLEDLSYDSFNAEEERKKISIVLTPKERLSLVVAYCQLGNKINKAVLKVKVKHSELSGILGKSNTTLSRVGLSHAALVRAIREVGIEKKTIQIRFSECKTPPLYQDPALAPYHPEGRDFYDKFGKLVSKGPPKSDYFDLAVRGITDKDKNLITKDLKTLVELMFAKKY